MGCPEATLDEILSLAQDFRLGYVELRSLGGTIDLPTYLKDAQAPNLDRPQVRLLATPLCLLKADHESMKTFYRFAELANRFDVPYLRVFGGGGSELGKAPDDESLAKAALIIETLRAHMLEQGWTAEILLETHDVFSSSERCLELNKHLDQPVKILWDSFHTWNLGGESPRESWDMIGPWIEHIHHHDSPEPAGSGKIEFVATGKGLYPCNELHELVLQKNYQGGLSLEWEKLWHPELPPVNDVLGDFVRVFGQ